MENQLEKLTALAPTPFDPTFNNLTRGQSLLMNLLKDAIEQKKPVTRDDIAECYIKSVAPSGSKTMWVWDNGKYTHAFVPLKKDSWSVKTKSIQWFKLNLGSCILKGKLLAIPVIEID